MRARLRGAGSCACRLEPGDLKRLPLDTTKQLLGYYAACPACGFRELFDLRKRLHEVEEGSYGVTLPDLRCPGCAGTIRVRAGDITTQPRAA